MTRESRAFLLGSLAVLLLAVVGGLLITGAADPLALADPGGVVRWGLPFARAVHDAAGALTLGAFLLAAGALPAGSVALRRAITVGAWSAVVWTLGGAAALIMTYAKAAGLPLSDPQLGAQLAAFLWEVDLVRFLLIGVLLAAVTAVAAAAVRTPVGAGLVAALAAAAWFPMALTGHAAGNANHETAVSGWWLHALGVAVWLGGLVTLLLLRGTLGQGLADVADRYSTLAGLGFALVVVSGVLNAWLRLERWSDLLEGYGLLVLLKTIGTLLLGAAGWWHRQRTLRAIRGTGGPSAFWRLAGGEVVLFAAVTGLAVVLGQSRPPIPVGEVVGPRTPAQLLTNELLPPPLTAIRWFTEWRLNILWVVVAVVLATWYVQGVRRLRARGDAWPWYRTLLWVLGCVVLVFVTSGGPAVYGRVLFSAHMVQHMSLAMFVPLFLVFGAPITLALRAVPRRTDGSRGPREWLLWMLETPWARFLSHPVVAAVNFAGSLVVFYYSPLFTLAMRTHLGHELMTIHFLLAGYLFAQVLVGIDPGPSRPAHPVRLLILIATMVFHAFFGVSIMASEALLASTWFSALGWGIDLLADQQVGGAIAWGIGEVPVLVLAMVVVAQWVRADDRETRRRDRAAARDDDADLRAYNEMLRRMDEHSGP